MSEDEQITGLSDNVYNLSSVLFHAAEGGQVYDKCVEDAERTGDQELDESLRLWQRNFSAATLRESLVEPSGLREADRVYYGERLPFYDLTLRLPTPVDWFRRSWDTLLSRLLLRRVEDPSEASAVMVVLEKP